MKKVIPWVVAMVVPGVFGVGLFPVSEAAPPEKGKPVPHAMAQFIQSLTGESCSIDCDGDGTTDYYTDASNAGACACACVDLCWVDACTAWDSEGNAAICFPV